MIRKIKPKKCKQCGSDFLSFRPLQIVCSPSCALKFNSKKEVDKRVKIMRSESRSLQFHEEIARKVFQKYIRERDKDLPCISCGTIDAKFDAGHFYKAELYSGLIFDEDNVNKQCSYCNSYLSGNLIEYGKGLLLKIGQERYNKLAERSNASRVYKYTRDELKSIIERYKAKVKLLASQD